MGCLRKAHESDAREPLQEGMEARHQSLDELVSPLKPVKTPTLLEMKEYKDLSRFREELVELKENFLRYKDDLEELRSSNMKVLCVGFIQEVLNVLSSLLLATLGKKLGNVSVQERKKLVEGPFKANQIFERKCGTYVDLARHNNNSPDAFFEALLTQVEKQAIEHYSELEDFPRESKHLRHLLLSSFMEAKGERDKESHIGMVKDRKKLDTAIEKVRHEIQLTRLMSVGMEAMVPLVNAGIHTCMSSLTKKAEEVADEEDHAANEEDQFSHPAPKVDEIDKKKMKKGVKVKILVRKKCADGCGLYVFGFHKNLGFGCIERAVPMLSQDGEVWWTKVAFSPNESITYQFVVKRMKQERELSDTHRRVVESTPCTFETIWS